MTAPSHRPLLLLALLALVGGAVSADERPTDELRQPDPFSRPHPHAPGPNGKVKSLLQQAGQLRTRASALAIRAEELWDEGKYDESSDLEEQANDLVSEQHRLESRARAIQMNPGVPESKIPTTGD